MAKLHCASAEFDGSTSDAPVGVSSRLPFDIRVQAKGRSGSVRVTHNPEPLWLNCIDHQPVDRKAMFDLLLKAPEIRETARPCKHEVSRTDFPVGQPKPVGDMLEAALHWGLSSKVSGALPTPILIPAADPKPGQGKALKDGWKSLK